MLSKSETIGSIIDSIGKDKSDLLSIVCTIKKELKHIDTEVVKIISDILDIPTAEIEGVLTFYSFIGNEKEGKYVIRLCKNISCALSNRSEIRKTLEELTRTKIGFTSKDDLFTLKNCNCLGMCDQGPALLINSILLSSVTVEDLPPIIMSCRNESFNFNYGHRYVSKIVKKDSLFNLLEKNRTPGQKYKDLSPKEIIEIILSSGLRGRGGAGYPTGEKWLSASNFVTEEKYFVCNADEGEPGTFKDRFLLDTYPDKIIEGLIIGAKAIGATKGIIYLRGEYTYLREKLQKTIDNYDFDISIHMGCGSYVCGEETALIESLEGSRGEARIKPPYPVESGYKGYPTVVNNVETLLDVSLIIENGDEYFRSIGTDKSKGTKFFSISGDIKNPGIYEIPFGVTIKELLTEIGAIDVKSVQMGGAAGTNIGKDKFNDVIAYEAIPTGGSIIVFNKDRNMLDVARNFMDFFVDESCGQCVPCREGSLRILEGIDNISEGSGYEPEMDKLLNLGRSIMSSSKCGLGQVCANAFISIIDNHRNEIFTNLRNRI